MLNFTKAFDKRAKIEPEWRLVMVGGESMNDQAQFFVGWGSLSLINAGLAQSKNRSGLLWWIIKLHDSSVDGIEPIRSSCVILFRPA